MEYNTKIKFIVCSCKEPEVVEEEVNEFCKGKDIVSIQASTHKIMIVYRELW